MSSSRADLVNEFIALDTNQYGLALRRDPRFPHCASLLFQQLEKLCIHVPLQVLKELHRNLSRREIRRVFGALEVAQECRIDYAPGDIERVTHWEQVGAKKGDAVIIAQLEAAGVRFLVSENRHFISKVEGLPFEVSTREQILRMLNQP